jgi:hypothetical protein
MGHDKNISPVGWYLGTYLLRFIELGDEARSDPERRFVSWENTVLVKANTMDSAYAKVERIARAAAKPYRGGPNGVRVKWEYVGVTEILPIYEQLGDGAEIAWAEHGARKLKTLQQLVKPKSAFRQ